MKSKTGKRKLEKLFGKSVYDTATARNYEGAPAFARSDEESLVRVLTTGTFEQTFYATAAELSQEALALFRAFAERDPHFLAQAIIYARSEGLMRIVPIAALVVLSAAQTDDAKELFRRTFPKVIQTPGDLQDFLTLCRLKSLRGMGKAVTHATQRWLASISQYHVIKYGSESQDMSLRDIYRLARPKLESEANAIARYVVRHEVTPELTQIAGYEALKREAQALRAGGESLSDEERRAAEERILALIAQHRLPWEVVAGQVRGSAAVWDAMLRQMPYMALLRNLNNAIKYDVADRPETLAHITGILADPERVRTSRQFPFAFYAALQALPAHTDAGSAVLELRDAVERALELSFQNMPDLGRSVLIANDISGSMSSRPSARSDMTMAEIAAVFAAAAFKKAEDGAIVSFDTEAHPRSVRKDQTIASIAQAVTGYGGGTSLSAPIEYAFGRKDPPRVYDVAIFITDSESWVDHLTRNRGVLDLIREYRSRVNPKLKCFFVQLLPYSHAVVPPEEPDCYYIYGWSSSILSFIATMLDGGQSQMEHVRQVTVL